MSANLDRREAGRRDEPCIQAPEKTLEVGTLALLPDERRLVGPRGVITLSPNAFEVARRLMRRPGVIVSRSDLIASMYPDGEEPEDPDGCLRQSIRLLREAINLIVGRTGVMILTEVGVGHSIVGRDS
jgi:DNA-binding response OmpR family regulator